MSRIGRKLPSPTHGKELEFYESLSPLRKTVHMVVQTASFIFVLGEERISALKGVARLAAVTCAPHLMEPTTALEALVMGFRKPWQDVDVLRAYEPELTPDDWARVTAPDWLVNKDERLPHLSIPAQLLLYQCAAWRCHWTFSGSTVGEHMAVWKAAPAVVRADPLLQQIVAAQTPAFFEGLVECHPKKRWDPIALAVLMQKSGVPSHSWLQNSPPETLRLLLPYTKDNAVVNELPLGMLHFKDSQLPLVEELHPALFFQSLILDKARREEPQAGAWFDRMWASTLAKTAQNSSYANTIITSRTMVDNGRHVAHVFESFAPTLLDSLQVAQTLEDNPEAAWRHWLVSHANASIADHSVPLPELDIADNGVGLGF